MSAHRNARTAGFLVLSIALLAATGSQLGAYAQDEIPKACQETGVNLQSACSTDIQRASTAFGVTVGDAAASKVSQSQVDAYLADPANKVTAGCCSAAAAFNAAQCNCNAKVLELAKSFVGGDLEVYKKVATALSQSCGYAQIC